MRRRVKAPSVAEQAAIAAVPADLLDGPIVEVWCTPDVLDAYLDGTLDDDEAMDTDPEMHVMAVTHVNYRDAREAWEAEHPDHPGLPTRRPRWAVEPELPKRPKRRTSSTSTSSTSTGALLPQRPKRNTKFGSRTS